MLNYFFKIKSISKNQSKNNLVIYFIYSLLLVSILIYITPNVYARNECICGICTSIVRDGVDECNNIGGSCTIPSCGSTSSCSLTCGTNMQCQTEPGYCSVSAYSLWNYGPTNKCYSFTSSFTGNAVCNMEIKTACFGLNNGQQTEESVRVIINGQIIGQSLDTLCNEPAPPVCHQNGPVSTSGNNILVSVNSGINNIRFESVKDSISIQSFTMNCVPQTQNPICGDGQVNGNEQCEQNSHCNDNNPNTADTCNQCSCIHTEMPYCGNGQIDSGEQCEQNNQCNDNNPNTIDTCNQCKCQFSNSNQCGDGQVTGAEQCEPPLSNNNARCLQETQICQGAKTGVRDAYGSCSSTCGCNKDSFAYTCLKNSCGAECSSHSDCDDDNSNTLDSCSADCGCIHQEMPYCGNNRVDYGEQCESDNQCSAGKLCSSCRCIDRPFCGDANQDSGEQCDFGSKVNGIPCVPSTNGTCQYCTSNCSLKTLSGGNCGNYKIEYGEECDEGANNGALCTPNLCSDFCVYCQNSCKIGFVTGPSCTSNSTIITSGGSYSTGGYWEGYGYYGYSQGYYSGGFNTPSASICGDGTIGVGEECDNGYENGIACNPSCNGECTYCSGNCEEVIIDGGICKRQARPWDPVVVSNPCKNLILKVKEARLDDSCNGNSKIVTREVNASDNLKARHGACNINSSYIYLNWSDISTSGGLKNVSIFIEHFEENSDIRVESFDGEKWIYQCDILRAARDSLDSCILKNSIRNGNVELRIKITRSGNNAYHNLDYVYLQANYCSGLSSCGNGAVDIGESCDDGGKANGDGCDEFCSVEYASCNEWSQCVDGKQEQLCYYGSTLKIINRDCNKISMFENMLVIWLVFLLILVVLLLLFFPALYIGVAGKKNK